MLNNDEIKILCELYDGICIRDEHINSEGRNVISFKLNGKWSQRQTSAFRLEAYLNRKLAKDETVDHIDDDKTNDDISNLQVLSRSENISKAWANGVYAKNTKLFVDYLNSDANIESVSGELNGMAKLTNEQVVLYRNTHKQGLITKSQIIVETGMCRRSIENMLNCKTYINV